MTFEPIPSTYQHLLDNIRINNIVHKVEAINSALGAEPGSMAFTADRDTTNHAVVNSGNGTNTVEVSIVPLDDLAPEGSIALVRIDVEGFENMVIAGGKATLSRTEAAILELNGSGARYGVSDSDVVSAMHGLGFASYTYDPALRKLSSIDPLTPRDGNTLFVRDAEFVAKRAAEGPSFPLWGFKV